MRHLSCAALLAMSLSSCGQTDGSNQEMRADDEAAIRAAYDAWVVAADGKDIESWVTFLGPDAIFLPPDAEAQTTYEEIRDSYVRTFEDPNWSITCEHTEVEIAEAGDMAWSRGNCDFTISSPDGKPVQNRSKWNKVWAKQSDGSWKNRLNAWSSTRPQALSSAQKEQIKTEVRQMSVSERDKVVQEITDILDAYTTSVATWDRDAIDRFWGDYDGFIFAGDGIILGGHSEWAVALDQYEKQVDRWLKFAFRNTHVEALSSDTATATTEFEHSRITVEGNTVNVRGAWTYVFKKLDGKWNVVHTNGTHVEF